MITDLFSHKLHSSEDEWPDKLTELAAIFNEFDGQLFDREAFERRLQAISPRASYAAYIFRDLSKFRDEFSAYPAYLGLYFLEQSPFGWVVRMSETAKRFLIREEPDVASFLRLQLPLFQYPSALGASYTSFTNRVHVKPNARGRTLDFIGQGMHLSPVRLIAIGLKADAELRGVSVLDASISFAEVFGLANTGEINRYALPPVESVADALHGIRQGRISVPRKYESRFHTLNHTEMFVAEGGRIGLRGAVNKTDRKELEQQFNAICSIKIQFEGFDHCRSGRDVEEVIASGEWGRYFDGVRMLPAKTVEVLTTDEALESAMPIEPIEAGSSVLIPEPRAETYPLRERNRVLPPASPYDRRRELADPELTRIKRQRRNLAHKELIDKMDAWLRRLGAHPQENEHIDLFAEIPNDGSFIFEMKSGGESLLDQIRKGLSQLYEYRYRYRPSIGDDGVSLCLVLPGRPEPVPWILDYLISDREINVCWFEDGDLVWPEQCNPQMGVLSLGSSDYLT